MPTGGHFPPSQPHMVQQHHSLMLQSHPGNAIYGGPVHVNGRQMQVPQNLMGLNPQTFS